MKNSYITVTDQFCGAGGSSQGIRRLSGKIGGGIEVKLAMNHWKLAIETHNTNFPDTLHDCADISASDPRRYFSTDILITSPECTNHTLAKGVKRYKNQMDLFNKGILDASAERSRATMWDVPRFAEVHKYNIIIVENVVDAREWVMYQAWLQAMHLLGYNHKAVYFNSMFFHPTPQSRDRMYVVFWKKGNPEPDLNFRPVAYCHKCVKDVQAFQRWKNPSKQFGKYKKQYVYICTECYQEVTPYYYAAFNCIDWSDIGTRIGDREKPLNENTIKRIEYGLKKYGKQPLLIHAGYSKEAIGTERSMLDPAFTQTSFSSQAIVNPFIINKQHSTNIDFRVKGINQQLPTIPATHQLNIVMPFIIKEEHSKAHSNNKAVTESFQTQTTRQSLALVTPFMVELKKASKVRNVNEPISCMTSVGYHGIVTDELWKSFISYFYGNAQASGMDEVVGTVLTKDRFALVSYKEPRIEDCYFRMLRPEEIKLAMAFDQDYIVLGNGKDKVKQCGNAVTPPVMEWITERCIDTLR